MSANNSEVKVTLLGHSAVLIQFLDFTLLLDPFITGNPAASVSADEICATHVLVTHGHSDHFGDADSIATRCGSTVFCTVECASLMSDSLTIEVGQPGGKISTEFGSVKFTSAVHGSGIAGALSCGFLITIGGKKIYFAGDTGLTMDMALLEYDKVDLALLPIGDRYTMGPEDACRAVGMIKPKVVVPMHYNTFPAIVQDPEVFKADVEATTDSKVIILASNESVYI